MFGLLISGRLVQTNVQQMSETQFVFTIPSAQSINHIVVFLTGQLPFPDGFGGAVHFSYPGSTGWQLLGHLTNAKPSAIFKVSKLRSGEGDTFMPAAATHVIQREAQIGISIEQISQMQQQTPATQSAVSITEPFIEFSNKLLQYCYNFLSSFALTQSQMVPTPNENYVPLSALQKWYETFQRKMQHDPYFWKL